jgi:hypothetical protein
MEPSNNNHDLVRRGLDLLREGLKPFIEQQMRAAYGESWEQEARNALRIPPHAKLNWDAAAVLKLIDRRWEEVFRKRLETRKIRSWVNESLELRNEYAHADSDQLFPDDDALRGLDTIGRLLAAVSSSESGKVMLLKAAIVEKTAKDPLPTIGQETGKRLSKLSPKRIWRVAKKEVSAARDGAEQRYPDAAKVPMSDNPHVSYRSTQLHFKASIIEPLADDNVFEIQTPDATWRMTKAQFYSAFPNVVASESYAGARREYFYTKPPRKADRFLV